MLAIKQTIIVVLVTLVILPQERLTNIQSMKNSLKIGSKMKYIACRKRIRQNWILKMKMI